MVYLIKFYQLILSPFIKQLTGIWVPCRYYPTCSEYSYESVKRYGLFGVWMGLKRIIRCNPLAKGGVDPVPKVSSVARA